MFQHCHSHRTCVPCHHTSSSNSAVSDLQPVLAIDHNHTQIDVRPTSVCRSSDDRVSLVFPVSCWSTSSHLNPYPILLTAYGASTSMTLSKPDCFWDREMSVTSTSQHCSRLGQQTHVPLHGSFDGVSMRTRYGQCIHAYQIRRDAFMSRPGSVWGARVITQRSCIGKTQLSCTAIRVRKFVRLLCQQ